ncbi:MAG: TIGR02266 family protein [Myxococcaceae bacterium]
MSHPPPKLIPLRIRLPYGSEDEFAEKYGPNVARGGIFIATKGLKPEGTALAFELILANGERLMRGEGTVVKSVSDETRSGMTVRFQKLDAHSKALVDRVLAQRTGVGTPQPPTILKDKERPPPHTEEQKARRRTLLEVPAAAPTKTAASADPILGIDMGTTNSRVAVFHEGKAQLIPLDSNRANSLPSIIALDEKGRYLFGARAKAQVLTDPKNTVCGAKRLVGRRARSRKILELQGRFPYSVVADSEGDAGIELRGKVHTLPELFAMLLRHLKQGASEFLSRPVARAVLCVPAYFNDHQRSAMLNAGKLAGLDILRILNEPSAVALAFGYGRGLARKRVLVYDLGGGTFDASVVQITGDDLEVVSTGGDNFLGGLDFDTRVASEISKHFEEREQSRLDDSLVAVQRLRDAAEVAKIALSDQQKTAIHIPFAAARSDGSPVDLRDELTREGLESLTADLVDRTLEVTQAVLEAGGLTPQSLDEIILVGGQSRTPLVRRRVESALGKPIRSDVDPHAAVALGAAILGHAMELKSQGKAGVTLSEVLSAPIGIALKGGGMRRVLERNTRLPAEKTIALPSHAGIPLSVAVFQGVSERAEENEYLGSLATQLEKSGDITLRFAVSPDGTLQLSAIAPDGQRVDTRMATLDAGDELRTLLLQEAPLPGEPDPQPAGLLQGIKRLFGKR